MALGRKRSPFRHGIAVVGALAIALCVLAASGDAAKPKKVATSAGELFVDADSVSGTVTSKRSECERKRKVKLRLASGDTLTAETQTNNKGKWEIGMQLSFGTYYVQVPKATKQSKNDPDTKLQCGGAKSKLVTV